MFEALLAAPVVPLEAVQSAIDVYEGMLVPSARFQVVDIESTFEVVAPVEEEQ